MPRVLSGHVEWKLDTSDGVEKWFARVRLPTGEYPWMPLPADIPHHDEERAKQAAVELQYILRGSVSTGSAESVGDYSDRWLKSRETIVETSYDEGHLRLHVFPVLVRGGKVKFGALPMRDVTTTDMREVVLNLDRKAHDDRVKRFAWKSACNVWATLSKMFDDAVRHKDPSLQVLSENPCRDVKGPDRGAKKAKQYLYPSEFLLLWACEKVPLRFREMYAILVYTYMRVGELEALELTDVDLEHHTISITKAVDRKTGKVKSTKSGDTRTIPIEPHLLPLLRRVMARGKQGKRGAFWLPPAEDRASMLRLHLQMAGVKRPALFVSNKWSKHITAHDLRATGITWAAVRGDEHLKIMQRAGHADAATSLIYIREAENLRAGFGEPFPVFCTGIAPSGAQVVDITATPMGIEPGELRGSFLNRSKSLRDKSSEEDQDVAPQDPPSRVDPLEAIREQAAEAMRRGDLALAGALLEVLRKAGGKT